MKTVTSKENTDAFSSEMKESLSKVFNIEKEIRSILHDHNFNYKEISLLFAIIISKSLAVDKYTHNYEEKVIDGVIDLILHEIRQNTYMILSKL